MKTTSTPLTAVGILLVALLLWCLPSPATAQETIEEARDMQARAEWDRQARYHWLLAAAEYPQIDNPESAIRKRMEAIDAMWEQNHPEWYDDARKPLALARIAARELGILSKAERAAARQARESRPVVIVPAPSAPVRPVIPRVVERQPVEIVPPRPAPASGFITGPDGSISTYQELTPGGTVIITGPDGGQTTITK